MLLHLKVVLRTEVNLSIHSLKQEIQTCTELPFRQETTIHLPFIDAKANNGILFIFLYESRNHVHRLRDVALEQLMGEVHRWCMLMKNHVGICNYNSKPVHTYKHSQDLNPN